MNKVKVFLTVIGFSERCLDLNQTKRIVQWIVKVQVSKFMESLTRLHRVFPNYHKSLEFVGYDELSKSSNHSLK